MSMLVVMLTLMYEGRCLYTMGVGVCGNFISLIILIWEGVRGIEFGEKVPLF